MSGATFDPAHFDSAYYERFYDEAQSRVSTQGDIDKLGRFVCSYADFLGVRVRKVVDLGCGVGHWKSVIARHYPKARYVGVEVSEAACEKYGWRQGSVVDCDAGYGDIVVCQGVLQYLSSRDARAAIDNLAEHCRGILYLEALTREDWELNCDRSVTDGSMNLRPASWYRKELKRHFTSAGGGVFIPRESSLVLYELERISI